MKLTSETTTNEETFRFTLDLNDEGEITEATQITYHCRACGEEVSGPNDIEVAACDEHPDAIIDSVISKVELVDTPTAIGDESDTDVVLFTYDSATLAGSFGLQVRDEDGGLKAICDLDGETISSKTSFIIPDKVPAKIAEYAQAICS